MNAHYYSKSGFVHQRVRRALQSGQYVPGQRIDPAMLAAEFRTSPTPVRAALYRLVGEGLLADHARNGLYVPLPTEVHLWDLYDWMERLLTMACEIVAEEAPLPPSGDAIPRCVGDDVVKLTWQLFDDIARETGQRNLHRAVKQANDRLAPIRRAKQDLIGSDPEEVAGLTASWQARDIAVLQAALQGYHSRRKLLVPRIVAHLHEGSEQLH